VRVKRLLRKVWKQLVIFDFGGGGKSLYGWMIIRKGIVDGHVFEEPSDMRVEEALDFFVIELGVHKHSADVGFNYIR